MTGGGLSPHPRGWDGESREGHRCRLGGMGVFVITAVAGSFATFFSSGDS